MEQAEFGILENSSVIKKVLKTYCTECQGTTNDVSEDKLWLLACSEIWNDYSDTHQKYGECKTNESTMTAGIEETRYRFFARGLTEPVSSSETFERVLIKNAQNSNCYYGLRSAAGWKPSDANDWVCNVTNTGTCGGWNDTSTWNMVPAFCI